MFEEGEPLGARLLDEAYMDFEWVREYPGAITVCDAKGFILYMNEMAGRAPFFLKSYSDPNPAFF